mgnify:CR=1 FL=1
MRINRENKSMDIEVRDWDYILSAYLRSYRFHNNNQNPEKIVFPMFTKAEGIPVEWLPEISPVITEIIQDGSNVLEATEEQIKTKDEIEDELKKLRKQVWEKAGVADARPKPLAPIIPPREPKTPTNPIPPGSPLDSMHPRDAQDLKKAKADLRLEPNVVEDDEVEVKNMNEKPVRKN